MKPNFFPNQDIVWLIIPPSYLPFVYFFIQHSAGMVMTYDELHYLFIILILALKNCIACVSIQFFYNSLFHVLIDCRFFQSFTEMIYVLTWYFIFSFPRLMFCFTTLWNKYLTDVSMPVCYCQFIPKANDAKKPKKKNKGGKILLIQSSHATHPQVCPQTLRK